MFVSNVRSHCSEPSSVTSVTAFWAPWLRTLHGVLAAEVTKVVKNIQVVKFTAVEVEVSLYQLLAFFFAT